MAKRQVSIRIRNKHTQTHRHRKNFNNNKNNFWLKLLSFIIIIACFFLGTYIKTGSYYVSLFSAYYLTSSALVFTMDNFKLSDDKVQRYIQVFSFTIIPFYLVYINLIT